MEPGLLMQLLTEFRYAILAPGAFLFGPSVSLLAGVLLKLEIISLAPTVIALAAGELGGDILWYWLGKKYGDNFVRRWGRYVSITPQTVHRAKVLFSEHHDIILFTSKLTAGFGFAIPVLFTAGLSHVPFKRYMMLNIAGQFLWTSSLLAIGYFLGHIYLEVGTFLEKMALFALIAILLASIIGFGRYLKSEQK
jgi:membrane-associated protein